MKASLIDPLQEAEIKAFHRGTERATLTTSPRPSEPEDLIEERPRPAARQTFQRPLIDEAEAEAEIGFDIADALMKGALDD